MSVSSSSQLLSSSRSEGPFLYLFNHVMGSNDYILYRIDALEHLDNKPSSTNTQRPYNLRPLLVFPEPVLPEQCVFAKLGSNFYLFGGQPSFGGKRTQGKDVYMMRESDLMDIVPSQRNTHGKRYLITSADMHGSKTFATVFVAENKLYVLSCLPSDTQFEVFDPLVGAWSVLPPQPDGYEGRVICYVLVDKIVYFGMCRGAVLSFHLEKLKWSVVTTHEHSPPVFPTYSFASRRPLVVIGGMAFGCVYDDGDGIDKDWDDSLNICATTLPCNGNFLTHEFMQPCIPVNGKLMDALNNKRCPHVTNKYYEFFSDYMVALDGGQVLCVISYGSGPDDDWPVDPYTSYVALTFFEITPSRGRGSASNNNGYANDKVDGKYVDNRCFKTKLLHTAQFTIKTTNLRTCGRIEACLSEGL